MTDNLSRLTAAPDLSLVTVDGVITETAGRYPRQLVLTDEVLVVAPGGYIGDRTRAEIDHAHHLRRPVRYWPHNS
ncbi:hypothetical protein ACPC54_38260 [Kitasatospora sp. NPDC094028]